MQPNVNEEQHEPFHKDIKGLAKISQFKLRGIGTKVLYIMHVVTSSKFTSLTPSLYHILQFYLP